MLIIVCQGCEPTCTHCNPPPPFGLKVRFRIFHRCKLYPNCESLRPFWGLCPNYGLASLTTRICLKPSGGSKAVPRPLVSLDYSVDQSVNRIVIYLVLCLLNVVY